MIAIAASSASTVAAVAAAELWAMLCRMTGGPFTSRRVGRRRARVVDQGPEDSDLSTKIVEVLLRLHTVRVHNGGQILARLLDPRDGVREGPLALVAGPIQLADVFVHGCEAMQNLIALVGFDGV